MAALLSRCGFDVAGVTENLPALRQLVASAKPSVVVVALPLPGVTSLAPVRLLGRESPACEIVLLSSFGTLQPAAIEAGARALVSEHDQWAPLAVLTEIAASSRATEMPERAVRAQVTATATFPVDSALGVSSS